MADINLFKREFNTFLSTFKDTSFDSENSINLCTDESQEVINFDKIVESKYPNSIERPKSFDAIYFYDKLIFCIEFKNQKPSKIDNSEVKGKIIDGKNELLAFIQNLNIQYKNYQFIYCVIYKECKEPINRYKCGIEKGKVQFGLDELEKNGFVKKVYTEPVSFFTKQFKKQLQKELKC